MVPSVDTLHSDCHDVIPTPRLGALKSRVDLVTSPSVPFDELRLQETQDEAQERYFGLLRLLNYL